MKLFIACLGTETNSFAPLPTGQMAFEEVMFTRQATAEPANLFSIQMHEWRRMAETRGWDVIESRAAFAQPAGPTVQRVYEAMRDEILSDLAAAQPDITLFTLHGAMIADGCDDCEGDLLARAREILGPTRVLGCELDLHFHLTEQMLHAADIMVAFKEYPHTDSIDRARELFDLAARTAAGDIRPVMAVHDCRMVAMYHTTRAPMDGFVADMIAAETGKVLSLSLCHGFPWGDCADVGTKMLAVTNGDADLARSTAQAFGERLWSLRDQILPDWPDIKGALDRAVTGVAPVVLADFADNAGGGAPADSTFVLQEILARGLRDVALGIYWDPVLVRLCADAGVGAQLDVRLGGKIGPMSGDPIDLRATIRGVRADMTQEMGGAKMPMGTGVWLESEGVHMVLSDKRTQAFHPRAFTDLGLDLSAMQVVVVKSSQHFYAGFAPIASEVIYIKGPGAISPDYAAIPYTKKTAPFWPKVADPF